MSSLALCSNIKYSKIFFTHFMMRLIDKKWGLKSCDTLPLIALRPQKLKSVRFSWSPYWLVKNKPMYDRVEWFFREQKLGTLQVVPNCCRFPISKYNLLELPTFGVQGFRKLFLTSPWAKPSLSRLVAYKKPKMNSKFSYWCLFYCMKYLKRMYLKIF